MLEKDKGKHLLWGFIIALIGGIQSSVAAGLTAEYKDKAHGGRWDNQDLAFTLLGGFFAEIVRIFIVYLFRDEVKEFINFVIDKL